MVYSKDKELTEALTELSKAKDLLASLGVPGYVDPNDPDRFIIFFGYKLPMGFLYRSDRMSLLDGLIRIKTLEDEENVMKTYGLSKLVLWIMVGDERSDENGAGLGCVQGKGGGVEA
ncbi:hypothetical protein Fot_42323 [Forsythia ovata]|uniref:Uncharacterized protein n=1 Tax=Forsythia ovata TaxID=205694 RepID=A0ABD1RLK8_9LAMI